MPLNRRLPKRGFNQKDRHPTAAVNIDVLEQAFDDGAEITAEILLEKHLIKSEKGGIKILGRGELTKKLTLTTNAISASARQKVENAGGVIVLIPAPEARAIKNRPKNKTKATTPTDRQES